MTIEKRDTLKDKFSTGQKPTEQDFANLIDSSFNQADDGISKSPGSPLTIGPVEDTGDVLLFTAFKSSKLEDPDKPVDSDKLKDAERNSWTIRHTREAQLQYLSGSKHVLSINADGDIGVCAQINSRGSGARLTIETEQSQQSGLSIVSPTNNGVHGMIFLNSTDNSEATGVRLMVAQKRHSTKRGKLEWRMELGAGDAPGFSFSRTDRTDQKKHALTPLTIAWNGYVAIGHSSPKAPLHINAPGDYRLYIDTTSMNPGDSKSGSRAVMIANGHPNHNNFLAFGLFNQDGDEYAWIDSSRKTLKINPTGNPVEIGGDFQVSRLKMFIGSKGHAPHIRTCLSIETPYRTGDQYDRGIVLWASENKNQYLGIGLHKDYCFIETHDRNHPLHINTTLWVLSGFRVNTPIGYWLFENSGQISFYTTGSSIPSKVVQTIGTP
ncbi:MAG: hypothetical protein KDA88_06435 [Planctomycetaceae bacterium]|nr:hypothetical protein [Planctomycetaceae bacterium]MCB9950062.1 hypothetical protein [Planctomycetaceae bacterium]